MIVIENIEVMGKLVKTTRRSQGLTQEQLAAACGVGRRFIIELESGKATCQVSKVIQVLTMLGITLHAIHRGE